MCNEYIVPLNEHRPGHVHHLGTRGGAAVFKLNCMRGPITAIRCHSIEEAEVNAMKQELRACGKHFCGSSAADDMTVARDDYQDAKRQGQKDFNSFAVDVNVDGRNVCLELRSGKKFSFNADKTERLVGAPANALSSWALSPLGDLLFFPSLNAAFYVPALEQGILGSKEWMGRKEE